MRKEVDIIFDKLNSLYRFILSTSHGKVFAIVLLLKIGIIFFAVPQLYTHWFIPFIENFVHSGYQNPWDSFLDIGGSIRAFPYGTGMLFILAAPFILVSTVLSLSPQSVGSIDLLLMAIPILIADCTILYLLIHSMNLGAKKSIYIYWCSPVVFYISYMFGQLDVIPMALMFGAIVLLIKNRLLFSAVILGIGLATKENLLFAVPFLMIYIFKKEKSWRELIKYFICVTSVYVLMIGPVFFSHGYQSMVFGAKERSWIYLSAIPFGDFEILLLPLAMGFLYLKFSLYSKLNDDILIMYLGLAFTVLLLFIPAATPGWYMWIIPFLCYYFINSQKFHLTTLVLFSLLFVMFFLFKVPYPLDIIDTSCKSFIVANFGNFLSELQVERATNLIFTFFQGIIAYTAIMMYFYGVRSNEVYKERKGPVIIGVGGRSGAGKDTFCNSLKMILGKKNIIQTSGDDHHKWERGHTMWKAFTHLDPKANDLFLQFDHAFSLRNGKTVLRHLYDHRTGKFTEPKAIGPSKYVVVSGLHPFYIRSMREITDIKVYFDTEKDLRAKWKIQRDIVERNNSRQSVVDTMKMREQDGLKYIEPQKKYADLVIRYEPIKKTSEDKIDEDSNVRVQFLADNSINFERLLFELQRIPTLKLSHQYQDADRQCLVVSGQVTSEQLKESAFHVIPNIRELVSPKICFEEGLKGTAQLVFLTMLSHYKKYAKL